MNKNNYILSLIIPVYNVAKYLRETLDNLKNQPCFEECELILINDGSQDNSLEILRDYRQVDRNIRIIDKPNEGVSATRNRGIEEAHGEYIYFMDADDLLHPNAISIILKEIKYSNADIVTWNFTTFYSKPNFSNISDLHFKEIDNSDRRAFNYLTEMGCAVSLCTKAIRRSLFDAPEIRLIPDMTYGEDLFVSWKCILKAKSIRYLDFPLYYYRRTGNSAVYRFHPNLYETYRKAFDNLRNFIINNGFASRALLGDIDYHFAKRLPALTLMESRAPYKLETKLLHLTKVVDDDNICSALKNDSRISGDIYDLARKRDVKRMILKAQINTLKARLLFPIKRFFK